MSQPIFNVTLWIFSMSDSFEGVPRSIMCWAVILTSLWLDVRMSNSRASLASDYLDNFYASLPPRSSTCRIFWIFAQFYSTKVVNMSYILDLCPILFHQGYQHVLYFGFLPPGRQTTRLSSCTGPHLANQREEQTHTQGPSLTVILHCLFSFSHSSIFLCLSVIAMHCVHSFSLPCS